MEGLIEPCGDSLATNNEVGASRSEARIVSLRPCRITFDGTNAPEAIRIEVRGWLDRLGALTVPMTGGHVVIESVDQISKDRLYRVHMELAMPAGVVVVGLDHPSNGMHEDIYVAIRNAFRGARRQLEIYILNHPVVVGIELATPVVEELPSVPIG